MAIRDSEKNIEGVNTAKQPVYPPRIFSKMRWIAGLFLALYLIVILFIHYNVTPLVSIIKKSFKQVRYPLFYSSHVDIIAGYT